MAQKTKQRAKGKWDGIIRHILGDQAISRKHTECPICGGKDRYRYDNNRNDGDWYCNQCGTGDGFALIMGALGCSFKEAAEQIDRIVGHIEEKPFQPIVDHVKRRENLNSLWASAKSPEVAIDYLTDRGIPTSTLQHISRDVRGIDSLALYDGKKKIGDYPAMLCLIRNGRGEPISIHRTYITGEHTKEKKIMPPMETITGGAVRLADASDTLILAEGIETALAAMTLLDHPAWATISAHGLSKLEKIPRRVREVIVIADNDASFTGQAAAFYAAKYFKNRAKLKVDVVMPPLLDTDMLDYMTKNRDMHLRTW